MGLGRPRRAGKGLLPPNPKQWDNEHHALDLREELQLHPDEPLPHDRAFHLLENVEVAPHGAIPRAEVFKQHLRNGRSWSGISIPLPGGGAIVLYNDGHPPTRVRATLMEEFFHLRLRHPLTAVRVYRDGAERSFNAQVENEAYGSGAAALVPYKALRAMIDLGLGCTEIAQRLVVSEQLVAFRAKVTRQYKRLVRP